ncbi:hypothetical protein [Streptomyces rhizosphaericus]|nr:hypothetical protein [Streptomyces rhizosphaericus]
MTDIQVGLLAQLLSASHGDWDRKAHRVSVLAQCVMASQLPEAWLARHPHDANAVVLHGWAECLRATRCGSMPKAQAVLDACHRASDDHPADPTPWVVILGVLRRLRCPQREVFGAWNEVLRRDRWHRQAYLQMLGYLSPAECGDHMQMMDFIETAQARMPATAPAIGLELSAATRQYVKTLGMGGPSALLAKDQWRQPTGASVLQRALDWQRNPGYLRHAAALADLNILAFALVAAQRTNEAKDVFAALAGIVTPWPWHALGDPLMAYERETRRALRYRSTPARG